jgi:hypothetical protein
MGGAGTSSQPKAQSLEPKASFPSRIATVAPVTIENPILNSPFQAPGRHFRFDNEGITTDIDEKRRPSAFFMPIARARKKGEQAHFDTEWTADRIKPNSEINRIRERVDRWRQGGYVDVTPAAEEARAVVEPVLRAWEVDADLRWNRGELRFEFDGADIIDRSPLPPGVIRGHAHALGVAAISGVGTVSVHVTRAHYPEPPGTFRLNPDAESILLRYQGYLGGREPLLSMAYFCLTVIEANAGSRASAAVTYGIEKAVLRKMRDDAEARRPLGADVLEGRHDTPHRAKQPDERRDARGGREKRHALLEFASEFV